MCRWCFITWKQSSFYWGWLDTSESTPSFHIWFKVWLWNVCLKLALKFQVNPFPLTHSSSLYVGGLTNTRAQKWSHDQFGCCCSLGIVVVSQFLHFDGCIFFFNGLCCLFGSQDSKFDCLDCRSFIGWSDRLSCHQQRGLGWQRDGHSGLSLAVVVAFWPGMGVATKSCTSLFPFALGAPKK